MTWITPPAYTEQDVVLDVVSELLAGGKATPLYQALVVEKRLCPNVSTWVDSNELASTFSIEATASTGANPDDIQTTVDEVLERLTKEGPTDDALARAKAGIELRTRTMLQLLNGGGGESGRAGVLQRFNHYLGDPGKLGNYMQRLLAVTKEDVRQVVASQLPANARAIVVTVPKETAPAEKGARK
jgi:zinc protease